MAAKLPAQRTSRDKPRVVEVRPEDVRLGQRGPERTDSLSKVVGAFMALAAVITVCGLMLLASVLLLKSWLQPGS